MNYGKRRLGTKLLNSILSFLYIIAGDEKPPIKHGGSDLVRGKQFFFFFFCIYSVYLSLKDTSLKKSVNTNINLHCLFPVGLVGEEKSIHMKVYWTLPCCGGGAVLVDEQENQTKTEPIQPF
uniref:Uncharacterized protein n=1 Tax=Sphaeramia orbicularis TaxID=375764 RepID=A0A673A3E4_9TELE